MNTEMTTAIWLDNDQAFSLTELSDLSGLSEPELNELVEYGVVKPVNPDAATLVFSGECLLAVRTAYRLRTHFDLELQGVALTVSLLERIRGLEMLVRSLRAQLPHPMR